MLFLAAAAVPEKLQKVPPKFWIYLAVAVVAVIVGVFVLRKVAGMNKVVLAVIVFVVVVVVGFNWIYERNEPAFLTPVVDRLAPFLPSKGSYDVKKNR